ncbi:thiamine pyrophosphokinase- eukaryotic [Apiospora rasikravindrae]|uniref:Thiamine pyrophosphokinase n=1 Tax=Apiospora rasikravindrae TaxID=990691 RepID=A0ABR1TY23_9PEZI
MAAEDPITDWFPARLFPSRPWEAPTQEKDHLSVIILNQPLTDIQTLKRVWHNSSYRVAADGGANHLYDCCSQAISRNAEEQKPEEVLSDLDVIIGDLDSLTETSQSYFEKATGGKVQVIRDQDQYSSDFTKALRHIRERRECNGSESNDIVCMGGLGGRVDQGLSQLHHLYLFQTSPTYAEGRVYLVSGESLTFLLKAGTHRIHVREWARAENGTNDVFGKHVGIIPVREPSVISTKGLEWDVEDWPTEFGGQISTSNHVLPDTEVVEVRATKDVLFTIALKGWPAES